MAHAKTDFNLVKLLVIIIPTVMGLLPADKRYSDGDIQSKISSILSNPPSNSYNIGNITLTNSRINISATNNTISNSRNTEINSRSIQSFTAPSAIRRTKKGNDDSQDIDSNTHSNRVVNTQKNNNTLTESSGPQKNISNSDGISNSTQSTVTNTQSSESDFSAATASPEESRTSDNLNKESSEESTHPPAEEEEEEEEEERGGGGGGEAEITTSYELLPELELSTTTSLEESPSEDPQPGVCPDYEIKYLPGVLVKCQCKGNEVLVDGECQPYEGNVIIDAEVENVLTKQVNVSEYSIIIQDVTCDNKTQYLEFTRGMFRLRPRGDMVLQSSAGVLKGHRITNYCITHHLDDLGDLTWTMKACILVPTVPRCCPPGQAMKEGFCQPANTTNVFQPPISAEPFSPSIPWSKIRNFLRPVNCTTLPLFTILLSEKQSNLVLISEGVEIGWIPDEFVERQEYIKCSAYCIDGIEEADGSVSYYASFCYKDQRELHREMCRDKPCIQKCCKDGEVFDSNRISCSPNVNATFTPPSYRNLNHYNIVTGWPLCEGINIVDPPMTIDDNGILIHKGKKLPAADYCVDTFLMNDVLTQSALACLSNESQWERVRIIAFPVCQCISLAFLFILFVCHLRVPKLLENGGVHQLCHAMALFIAYSNSFTIYVFKKYLKELNCFIVAIFMQFGYLTTFFWLNVICFEIWRKIRTLKLYRSCKPYPSWPYMLYGWGVPSAICSVTVGMQYLAPDHVSGIIKPHIGISRCWFREDLGLLVYFYGPIAFLFICNTCLLILTYISCKQMLRSYKENNKCLKDLGAGATTSIDRRGSSSSDARQLTDHVNDYKQRLKLFVLMATCWVTEVLSWKIAPLEVWSFTDIINSLQGFFIFIIFLSNRNKRKLLEESFPFLFVIARKIRISDKLRVFICLHLSSFSFLRRRRRSSASTVISNLSSTVKSTQSLSFESSASDCHKSSSSSSASSNSYRGGTPAMTRSVSLDVEESNADTFSDTFI